MRALWVIIWLVLLLLGGLRCEGAAPQGDGAPVDALESGIREFAPERVDERERVSGERLVKADAGTDEPAERVLDRTPSLDQEAPREAPIEQEQAETGEADGGEQVSLPLIKADLIQWVTSWDYSREGGDAFRALPVTKQADMKALIRAFLQRDISRVQQLAPGFGMALSILEDTDGGRYWLLAETQSPGQGHGIYLQPEQPLRDFVLQAPHPIKDTATHSQGAFLMRALRPRLLMIASVMRCDASTPTSCSGSTSQCGGRYRISDVAHFTDTGFHLAHIVVDALWGSFPVFQLHGFARRSGEPSALLSDGTKRDAPPGAWVLRLRDAYNVALHNVGFQAAQSCNDPADTMVRLCGTTNVQGRHTNGSMDACTQAASQSQGRFVHVEQRKSLRTGSPGPAVLLQALRLLFP